MTMQTFTSAGILGHTLARAILRWARRAALVAIAAWAVGSQGLCQTPPLLTTDATNELQDGEGLDFVGERDVGLVPSLNRVWIAQGRVRAALQASTGQRLHGEDVVFPKLGSCP